MTSADYVVVGSGLTGAVIARLLTDADRDVVVVDRRDHAGGNVHDSRHASGVRIHTYGPHYFRTNSAPIWEYVNRFASFYKYEAVLATRVDGRLERWPVAAEYIERTIGRRWEPGFAGQPQNFEDASLAKMPRTIYEKFVKGYTEKQWGVPANSLAAGLAGRFEVRASNDTRLKQHRHQGIPTGGYAELMRSMLHGVPVELGCDYLLQRDRWIARRKLIFTGPIDEFFGFDLGRLTYRGQIREHTYLPDVDEFQAYGQVNNPDPADGPSVRTLEWKHMLSEPEKAAARGTVLTTETPFTPDEPDHYEYPFPDAANAELYKRYRARAATLRHSHLRSPR